jgi:alkylation response protein AidB-like acyl-CoA dehydrogenase
MPDGLSDPIHDVDGSDEDRWLTEVLAARLATLTEPDRHAGTDVAWAALTEIGVIGIGSPISGGTATSAVLVAEQLGRALVGGPVLATGAACLALDDAAAERAIAGRWRVTLGEGGLFPWGLDVDQALETVDGELQPVTFRAASVFDTMAGEVWVRATTDRHPGLDRAAEVIERFDLTLAGYLNGAAEQLLELATEHARQRRQFGHPIGDHQAIAHPLVDAWNDVTASRGVARAASVGYFSPALARHAATRAAVQAAVTAHQVFGAMGYSVEGGVGTRTLRIRQWSVLPPALGPRLAGSIGHLAARAKTKQS